MQFLFVKQQQKANMLIAGTSLNRNLHNQVIKNVTDCNVTFVEAFTVDQDKNAYYPDKNFLRKVPEELERKNYTVLVLSCGPNEISNLNTSLNYSDNIDYWRQKAAESSQKMYNLAEFCLNQYSSLESVIIVKRPPRYDDRIKSHLSEYANSVLDDISTGKNNKRICVSKQDLGCDGKLRVQRFGDPFYSNNYDGVHMRGAFAIQHMTRSFINMMIDIFPHLKPANIRNNIPPTYQQLQTSVNSGNL